MQGIHVARHFKFLCVAEEKLPTNFLIALRFVTGRTRGHRADPWTQYIVGRPVKYPEANSNSNTRHKGCCVAFCPRGNATVEM
eukprot:1408136-Rhodomonas_salina.2